MNFKFLIAPTAMIIIKKLQAIQNIVDNIKVHVDKISNFHIAGGNATFNLTIRLSNPTTDSLKLNTFGMGSITEIKLYDVSGKYVGSAYPKNVTHIVINPTGDTYIKDIPTSIGLINVTNTLLNNFSTDPKAYRAIIVIRFLGKTFQV